MLPSSNSDAQQEQETSGVFDDDWPQCDPDLMAALSDPAYTMDMYTAASVGDLDHLVASSSSFSSVDPTATNKSSWTALMYASYYDHSHVVRFLMDLAAGSGCMANRQGRTALMMAAMCGNDTVAKLLVCHGGRDAVQATDRAGQTALVYAVLYGHSTMTQLLLEAGSDVNRIDSRQGFSPLMVACQEGHERIAQMLLHYGADPAYVNIVGESPRTVCAKRGHDHIVKLLVRAAQASSTTASASTSASRPPSVLDAPARLLERLQVKAFLQSAGVEKYYHLFDQSAINLEQMMSLTDNDLKEMGLTLLGPRRRLTSAIARRQQRKSDDKDNVVVDLEG